MDIVEDVLVKSKVFHEQSYAKFGFAAQRRWPNEELCRFMGRNFFNIPLAQRKDFRILETGCGTGANLWMIANEGFDTYGIDFSPEAIQLCEQILISHGTTATLAVQDMSQMDFPDNFFDGVVDVFSSYCMPKAQHQNYLQTVARILKPTGKFFSYFPSKTSDTYLNPGNARFLDSDTLDGVNRNNSPFSGHAYPFRFMHPQEYKDNLKECGLECVYLETNTRTYHMQSEIFSFVVVEAKNIV